MTKKRILCVEDHPDTCELISTILKKFEVVSAYSMADALMQASSQKFDLYLLDFHLPDGNGIELCLLIKNFDTETPILFVTATSQMNEKQALKIGAQGLIKPTASSFVVELEKRVTKLIEQKTSSVSKNQ